METDRSGGGSRGKPPRGGGRRNHHRADAYDGYGDDDNGDCGDGDDDVEAVLAEGERWQAMLTESQRGVATEARELGAMQAKVRARQGSGDYY